MQQEHEVNTQGVRLVRDSLGMGGEKYTWSDGPLNTRCLLAPNAWIGHDVEAVIAIGAFDGLHLGHRKLIKAAINDACRRNVPCFVITFEPDPEELFLGDEAPQRILSCEDRARMIAGIGVDGVIMLHFDAGLAAMGPTAFVKLVLCWLVKPVSMHVGNNFHFGYHGMGSSVTLRACGLLEHFEVHTHSLVERDGKTVSSTRIRELLSQPAGISEANELLSRCHFLRGTVKHGRGEGSSFGFPTANVDFPSRVCMPAQGVYAGYVVLGNAAWPAAINVGAPPTFGGDDDSFCEANLIGFDGDLYGNDVAVIFVEWLRASRTFDSLDELERVVLDNIEWVRTNLGDGRVEVALDH
ncbi:MAG: riboflavin biosynthesis protein RibF [Coriobacteriales bacterium]|nr:riboflavin biosynthesis protein RibF [Coriobacteriales bacterium]MDO5709650.1 riboflavin biosynthesis protein RibF [Coriobacteriales bacterium]